VICFDSRDCGLSTKMDSAKMLSPVLLLPTLKPNFYTLSEMAQDTAGACRVRN